MPDREPSSRCGTNYGDLSDNDDLSSNSGKDMQVNILEAKKRLLQLIRSVQAGEEVVIANRGEPVARLVPAREIPDAISDAGSARVILSRLDNHSPPDYARRIAEEIDTAIEEQRRSWD